MTARPRRNSPVADDASRRTRGERRERPPAAPPGPATARDWAAPLAAVTLVWIVLFAPLLFGGQRVVFGDAATFRPFPAYSRARWHESHVRTHWNPYVFMGLESVGSLADSRPQYLPDALVSLVERLHEPQFAPQLWLLLLHLAAAFAVLALCRRLWLAPPWAAACAAIAVARRAADPRPVRPRLRRDVRVDRAAPDRRARDPRRAHARRPHARRSPPPCCSRSRSASRPCTAIPRCWSTPACCSSRSPRSRRSRTVAGSGSRSGWAR
jgi:hypothetical protein